MTDEVGTESDAPASPGEGADGSIRATFLRVATTAREAAEAELAWFRLKGGVIAGHVKRGLIFATVALVAFIVLVVLLFVALILALEPFVGLLGATLIVAGVALIVTIVMGVLARKAFLKLSSGSPA